MSLIDTHCHLTEESLAGSVADVVRRAEAAGVQRLLCVGIDAISSAACVRLTGQFPGVHAAVGIQPNHVAEAGSDDWEQIVALVRQGLPGVVAIGETGLDRYWHDTPFPLQQEFFDRHLTLSQQTGLPFIVHMRDCDADVLEMLRIARGRGELRGVMHSFTGSIETMWACVELGLHVSFAGMVTYKKSDALRAIARAVPEDRLLIETDSPYLSPHPHRAVRPNEPALLVHTAQCLAEVRGVTGEQLASMTTANAERLFGFGGGRS